MTKQTLQFYADWKSVLFLVFFLPLLVFLGFWQIHRGEEKLQLTNQYQAQLKKEPFLLAELTPDNNTAFTPVTFVGQITSQHYFLLDNQIRNGKVGFDVLVPVETEKQLVIVNLGWVISNVDRTILPVVNLPNGQRKIEGFIYRPATDAYVLEDEPLAGGWPKVIQSVEMKKVSALYKGREVFPFVIRANSFLPFAFDTDWPTINLNPQKHFGYAIQWFLMAFALVVLFFALNSNFFNRKKNNEQ